MTGAVLVASPRIDQNKSNFGRNYPSPGHRHAGLVPASNVPQTVADEGDRALRLHDGQRAAGTLYVGVTSNLVGRVMQHREGTFDGFTQRHRIDRLVWFESGASMEGAIVREKAIKKWRRDWKCNLIERGNPEWNDLADGLGLEPLP